MKYYASLIVLLSSNILFCPGLFLSKAKKGMDGMCKALQGPYSRRKEISPLGPPATLDFFCNQDANTHLAEEKNK